MARGRFSLQFAPLLILALLVMTLVGGGGRPAQAASRERRAAKGVIELRQARFPAVGLVGLLGLVVLAAMVALLADGAPAHAGATFVVTKGADTADGTCDGDCSLREAVIAANAAAGHSTITVPAGTYTLSIVGTGEEAAANGDLDITDDLTITGAGAGSTIIDGNGAVTGERVIQVDPLRDGIRIEMSSVAIQNGNDYNGGGIDIVGAATATLTNVTISGNTADWGGGIDNRGTATLTNVTISGNTAGELGGGIRVGGSGVVTLTDSTISGNTAQGGGGMLNWNTATLTNVTVSDNQADDTTGDWSSGMDNWGTATLTNVTISGNTGWGFMNHDAAVLANTIVANNSAGDCAGSFTSGGHNLIEDTADCTITGDTTGNITGADPALGPLADNGGPTETHALLPGSPAIDAGDNGACPATDQRGVTRPQGASCDMGAFELEAPAYSWTGFFQPVDNPPLMNAAKAGRAIPVKFSLGGDQGLDIFDTGYPRSRQIDCDTSASADGVEQTVTAGSSSLSYDPIADQYIYVWKTAKAWANTCRELVVRLDDSTEHLANFKFR
jgi:CSLREA domain-containing protein